MDNSNTKKDSWVSISIMAAAVLIAGAIIYSVAARKDSVGRQEAALVSESSQETGVSIFDLQNTDIILGEADAPVTLIEFGDFQCHFCGKLFTEAEAAIREEYIKTGKAKIVWRDFVFLGQESENAAEAARCAGEQGKFWEYHDSIFYNEIQDGWENENGSLSIANLKSLAKEIGLDEDQFNECLDSGRYASLIEKYSSEGLKAGIQSTPTMFIGEQKVEGALPFESFKTIIESQINL